MPTPEGFPWSFRDVCVSRAGAPYFVAGRDDSTNQRVPVTDLLLWDGGWTQVEVPFVATSVCVTSSPSEVVYVMGVRGNVLVWDGQNATEEIIDQSDEGPQFYGDLTEIRAIDDIPYVVGMCRTVYRKDGPDLWARIDQSCRTPEDDDSDAGFTSIDGFDASDIYAVGWDGEIWCFDGTIWRKIDSPVNGILFKVVCGGDGVVYACGQKGILVAGRNSEWRVVEHEVTRENLWGAAWFGKSLYVSGTKNLYRFQDGVFDRVVFPEDSDIKLVGKNSFYSIDANDRGLWSAGRKLVVFTRGGSSWDEPSYPEKKALS